MKSNSVIRKIDESGRILIPKKIRKIIEIMNGEDMEIFVEGNKIVIQKNKPYATCLITNNVSQNTILIGNRKIVLSLEGIEYLIDQLKKYLLK